MRMFLSVDGKQTDIELRHELKEQMMDVTLHVKNLGRVPDVEVQFISSCDDETSPE